ncbi:hypothetical protein ILUMI_14700, partial [Ignelater luminosus]
MVDIPSWVHLSEEMIKKRPSRKITRAIDKPSTSNDELDPMDLPGPSGLSHNFKDRKEMSSVC